MTKHKLLEYPNIVHFNNTTVYVYLLFLGFFIWLLTRAFRLKTPGLSVTTLLVKLNDSSFFCSMNDSNTMEATLISVAVQRTRGHLPNGEAETQTKK